MMRAIVMEITEGTRKAIILTDDGIFAEVDDLGYEVGQTIEHVENTVTSSADASNPAQVSPAHATSLQVSPARVASSQVSPAHATSSQRRGGQHGAPTHAARHGRHRKIVVIRTFFAAAACLAIAALGILTFHPYAYATLDSDLSVKYTSNIFNQVLSAEAVGDDTDGIVSTLNGSGIWFHSLDDVVSATVDQLYGTGHLDDAKDGYLVLAVYSSDGNRASELARSLSDTLTSNHASLTVIGVTVDKTQLQEADDLGTTAGKLYLIERIEQDAGTGDAVDTSDLANRSIPDLIRTMDDHGISIPDDVVYRSDSNHGLGGDATGDARSTTDTGGDKGDGTDGDVPGGNGNGDANAGTGGTPTGDAGGVAGGSSAGHGTAPANTTGSTTGGANGTPAAGTTGTSAANTTGAPVAGTTGTSAAGTAVGTSPTAPSQNQATTTAASSGPAPSDVTNGPSNGILAMVR